MEVTDIGKNSSLLRYGKNYCRKKFYRTGPWWHFTLSNCKFIESIFQANPFLWSPLPVRGIINKDPTVWLDGAIPTTIKSNCLFGKVIVWWTQGLLSYWLSGFSSWLIIAGKPRGRIPNNSFLCNLEMGTNKLKWYIRLSWKVSPEKSTLAY
jgi:hypothetical protein